MASKTRLFLHRLTRRPAEGEGLERIALSYVLVSLTAFVGFTLITTGLVLLIGEGFNILNPVYIGGFVLIIFLFIEPLRVWWEEALKRTLFREKINFENLELTFSAQLLQKASCAELSQFITQFLSDVFQPNPLYIYLYDHSTEQYRPMSSKQGDVGWIPGAISFDSTGSLASALGGKKQPVALRDLEELDEIDSARLALLDVHWLVPMHARDRLVGWIALGECNPPLQNSSSQRMFLQEVGEHSARALDRAMAVLDLERHVQQMRVLSRVAQGVNFAITLDDLLELVYAQTSQVIPTNDFFVLLHDETSGAYTYAFYQVNGEREAHREHIPVNITQCLEHEVFRTQSAISTKDYEALCRSHGYLPQDKGILSWMAVPLNAGAQVIGVISLGSRDAEVYFSAEQLNFLQAVADQVAGVIIKTRLLQETEKRAHQLATLNEISLSLTSTLQLEGMLEQMMRRVVDLLQCEAATLFFVDPSSNELIFEVLVGFEVEGLIGKRIPPGTGVAGKVAQNRAAMIINQANPQDHWVFHYEGGIGIQPRSILAVPMIYQTRLIGVIEAVNKRDGSPFTASEQDLLNALSAQASVAIENARLYTMTDQALAARVEELSVMQHIDRELNASLDRPHAMTITLDWALKQSKAEAGFIASVEKEELNLMAERGFAQLLGEDQVPFEVGMDWKNLTGVRQALSSGQVQVIIHEPEKPRPQGFISPQGCTQVVLPIKREFEILGLLVLESTHENLASKDTLAFLLRLCNHSAIAIANARLYAQVHEANLAKSKFVSFVAHELKNPMASIKGYTELVASGMAGPITEMQAAFLETVRQNVDRMNNIVSDLNDLTKIQVGNLRLDYASVSLLEAIQEVKRSLETQMRSKGQTLAVHVPSNIPPLWADPARLVQILTNLVSNAHKYTPEGGLVSIGAESTASDASAPQGVRYVHIWVKDSGIGIEPQDQELVFQPYFRSEKAKEMASGTGLGLNITKSLIEMQGGRIWFESQPGKGTIFHFTLPCAEVPS